MIKLKINDKLMALLLLAFISACGNDEPIVNPDYTPNILVINEGNFLSGDGTISTIDLTLNEVELSKFASTNGFPVAATIQSITAHKDKYYIVANNASKIEVVDADFQSQTTIKSTVDIIFKNPFDLVAQGTTAFVSNWGEFNAITFGYDDGFIGVIDLSTSTLTSKIDRHSQPQDLLILNDELYITNVSSNTISVLDVQTFDEIKSIEVPFGPDKMLVDKDEKIWAICSSRSVVQIDPVSKAILKTIDGINAQGFNEKFAINKAGDKLYYLSFDFATSMGAVYDIGIDDNVAPVNPIVSLQNPYGLGLNDDMIYIGNSNAFQANGVVEQYSLDGDLLNTFDCGRGPNGFIFLD